MKRHRYVFVGGLHRSGTSLVARMIGSLPDVASIESAPVPENEGVYLQGAIPHTARHGIPMHFAIDPAQHHVEGSALDRLEVRERLEADWAPWFGPGAWRVEKSPVNLTRMRLYQQLFPLSQFVVVVRHPEAVAGAVAKWRDMKRAEMIAHWVEAHGIVGDDLPFLHAALVLRYEDVVSDPVRTMARLAAFLSVEPASAPEAIRDGNADYEGLPAAAGHDAALARWGYAPGLGVLEREVEVAHPLRAVREAVIAAGK